MKNKKLRNTLIAGTAVGTVVGLGTWARLSKDTTPPSPIKVEYRTDPLIDEAVLEQVRPFVPENLLPILEAEDGEKQLTEKEKMAFLRSRCDQDTEGLALSDGTMVACKDVPTPEEFKIHGKPTRAYISEGDYERVYKPGREAKRFEGWVFNKTGPDGKNINSLMPGHEHEPEFDKERAELTKKAVDERNSFRERYERYKQENPEISR